MKREVKPLEKAAVYRELSEEELRQLEDNPATEARLAAYQGMDRQLADLPELLPDRTLRHDFYAQLEEKMDQKGFFRRLPSLAGNLALLAALILVVIAAAYMMRTYLLPPESFQAEAVNTRPAAEVPALLAVSPTPPATPTPLPTESVRERVTRTFNNFPYPTPTHPAEMDLNDPFRSFGEWMAGWGETTSTSQAFLIMRAVIKIYLEEVGGLEALLADPSLIVELENRLRPHIPYNFAETVQLVEVTGDGHPDLIVALLPNVDVYIEDEQGIIHARGLPQVWSGGEWQGNWPSAVTVDDLQGNGQPELRVSYANVVSGENLVQIVQWNSEQGIWEEKEKDTGPATLMSPQSGQSTPTAPAAWELDGSATPTPFSTVLTPKPSTIPPPQSGDATPTPPATATPFSTVLP